MMRLIALAASVSACAPITSAPAPSSESDPQLLTAFFEDARSIESGLAADFACVSLRQGNSDRDPDGALIASLSARWSVPVIAGSRCSSSGEGDTVAAPGASGSGKWLRVANLQCSDRDRCTADVSYYVANLGAGGRSVTAERTADGWKVAPSGPMWIS